jgi:hypothetical protein
MVDSFAVYILFVKLFCPEARIIPVNTTGKNGNQETAGEILP